MLQSERPNCTPCPHCGRCDGCGIRMTHQQTIGSCPICRRYADNGMARAPRLRFLDDVQSGALVLRKRGLAIVA